MCSKRKVEKDWKLFQNPLAEEGLLNAAQDPRAPREPSAPQGLDMSSRGQRPRKPRPLTPFSLSPPAGRGVPKAGCGVASGGFIRQPTDYSICSPPGSTASRAVDHPRRNRVPKVLKQLLTEDRC